MSTLYTLVAFIVVVALLSAFMILLMGRIGLRDTIIMKVPSKTLSELFSCDFCLGFWLSAILATYIAIYEGEPIYLTIPLFSTPIIRLLV